MFESKSDGSGLWAYPTLFGSSGIKEFDKPNGYYEGTAAREHHFDSSYQNSRYFYQDADHDNKDPGELIRPIASGLEFNEADIPSRY